MPCDRRDLNFLKYLNHPISTLIHCAKQIKRKPIASTLVLSGPSTQPNIALTFDDGPHPEWTPKLLKILNHYGAKATFFCRGNCVIKYPNIVQQAHEEGHLIANHTYSHLSLPQQDDSTVLKELRDTNIAIQTANGTIPIYFRPPYGETDNRVTRLAKQVRLTPILWSIDTNDWRGLGVDAIVAALMSAKNGSIILCHDGVDRSDQTLVAVDQAIPLLQAKGFQFVTISELLENASSTNAQNRASHKARGMMRHFSPMKRS